MALGYRDHAAMAQRCLDAGMTQTELAEALGVSQAEASRIAGGLRKKPSLAWYQTLIRLHDRKLKLDPGPTKLARLAE